jgi:uncharacterized membrane protein YdjX (TVP38/TMEM64 family)
MVAIYTGIYLGALLVFFVGKELLRRSRANRTARRPR